METREKLKKILSEWAAYEIPPFYERDFNETLLRGSEILSIMGARRVGKTYLCYQLIQHLRKTLSADNVAYINLEDERLYPLNGDELTLLWDVYLELFQVDLKRKVYLFVDEIQNIPHWSKWARRLTDQNKNLKLVITGSSSKLLGQEIATELRGRTLNFTLYPLSFREYLRSQGVAVPSQPSERLLYGHDRIAFKKHFNEYVQSGGFPAVLESEHPQELLKGYYHVMFYRDLVERYQIKSIKLFEDYLALLFDQMSSHFSISSTAKKLEACGYSLSKNTLSNFSKYTQEAFLIFEVRNQSFKIKEVLRSPKKIYVIDHGLAQAVRFSSSEDRGRILENIVFLALKRKGENIRYFREKGECDFLLSDRGRPSRAIQVTQNMASRETREREFAGIQEVWDRYPLKEGIILTEDDSETLKMERHEIRVLPIWYWLLNMEG